MQSLHLFLVNHEASIVVVKEVLANVRRQPRLRHLLHDVLLVDCVALSLSQVQLGFHYDTILDERLVFFRLGAYQVYELTSRMLHHNLATGLWQHAESVVDEASVHRGHGQACVLTIEQDGNKAGLAEQALVEAVETRLHHLELLAALL